MALFHARCAGVLPLSGGEPGPCDACGAENLGRSDLQARELVPRQLAERCWVVECCSCGHCLRRRRLLHFESWLQLAAWAAAGGWSVRPDGQATCAECTRSDSAGTAGDSSASTPDSGAGAVWDLRRVHVELDTGYAGTIAAFTGFTGADGPAPSTVPVYLDIRPVPGGGFVWLTIGGTNVRARMNRDDARELARVAGLAADGAGSSE